DFDNTIGAMEQTGRRLRRVAAVFFNLCGSHTNDEMQTIQREMAPVLAKHNNEVLFNRNLFARVAVLYELRAELRLDAEQARVLERYHTMFVRAGALLDGQARERMDEITQRLAVLGTRFGQNILADEKAYELVLDGEDDLAGLPDFLVAASAAAARERGEEGRHVITLSRSLIEPFLQFSERRDLREQAFKAWISRGENGGETDNREIVAETVALRAERAKLLGYDNFAAYKVDDEMAKTPDAVRDLLMRVWAPARQRAETERQKLQEMAQSKGENFEIAAWDWRYYAEKVRKAEHDLDEAEIKPYFQLDRIIEAAFDTAHRLFGLNFRPLDDVPLYHPEVRPFEVTDAQGRHVGIFLGDYFARSSKRSGAWASAFRSQRKLGGEVRPIIVNVMNFAKGAEGEANLLTFDDARTLFHEFGHALHGLMSDVTYPKIAGTSVARDFVELPSQLYEHWLEERQVLGKYAVHYKTGEPIPEALLDRLIAARNFNQGFATVEYVASALVDLEMHLLTNAEGLDVTAFEADVLDRIAMPEAITMRHRVPHFAHVFSGDGYSAGYYSYLWSEVMDADAFAAFEETGDIFDPETAKKLATHIYSAGGRIDEAEAYAAFRGRKPEIDALLEKRGLKEVV
ncbi:MAG TPA: M3 family metallopeptidase, partial [Afifellaceae bacterium]|nr:M3 family metallopeptidase [Afifellaceae bacterium]